MKLIKVAKKVRKEYGHQTIRTADEFRKQKLVSISTGSYIMDVITGIGGFAKGRIIEVYGGESVGKSSLLIRTVASLLKRGGKAVYIDAERALEPAYCKHLGIKLKGNKNLLIENPDSAEQALDSIYDFCGAHDLDLVVLDSVAAISPEAELESSSEDNFIGLMAKKLTVLMRKVTTKSSAPSIVLINQIRDKIKTGFGFQYGDKEDSPGGHAIRHHASMRIKLTKVSNLYNKNKDKTGIKIKVYTVKSKISKPYRTGTISFDFDKGFLNLEDIITNCVDYKIIKKKQGKLSFEGKRYKKSKFKLLLKDKEFRDRVLSLLKDRIYGHLYTEREAT